MRETLRPIVEKKEDNSLLLNNNDCELILKKWRENPATWAGDYELNFGDILETLRVRIEFFKSEHPAIKQRNKDIAFKLGSALSSLLLQGYPIGFKMSTGELRGSEDSAAVLYVQPMALLKTLKELVRFGLFSPQEIKERLIDPAEDKGGTLFYQADKISRFNIRRSNEADFTVKENNFMDKVIREELYWLKIRQRGMRDL